MNIDIRYHGIRRSKALSSYALRKLHRHLARMAEPADVVVRFSDVNGPRGGIDKACRLNLSAPMLGSVTTSVVRHDLYTALDEAADRLIRTLRRRRERNRSTRRRAA